MIDIITIDGGKPVINIKIHGYSRPEQGPHIFHVDTTEGLIGEFRQINTEYLASGHKGAMV